jgi:hypothetical protein
MSDWIGLGLFVLVLAGALLGLSQLGKPRKPLSREEYEQRVADGRGWMSTGAFAGMIALQKFVNPKAVEAIEVQKDLKAGFYNDEEKNGEGDEPEPLTEDGQDNKLARERADEPRETLESVRERLRKRGKLDEVGINKSEEGKDA